MAKSLKINDLYHWSVTNGYFPEAYVMPPCYIVTKHPEKMIYFYKWSKKNFKPPITQCLEVHFPKTDLTDRTFGIIDPFVHNDIAYHISRNWKTIVDILIPEDSIVASYSFPIPIGSKNHGRIGHLRSGRMIYEFIDMTEDDLPSVAYRYNYIVRSDVKNFYPSIYTHSIAWAIHGKKKIRKGGNRYDYTLLGNRLDKLFQNANDGRTNGLPIGPVVSDIVAEAILSSVDRVFSKLVKDALIDCEAVRFKDDYRILVKSYEDAKKVVKYLQKAFGAYHLELSEEKTRIDSLPNGLYREWVSKYHAVHPRKRSKYSWKQFRELYLAVLKIDREHPGTGVIDRFLADIVSKKGHLKIKLNEKNLEKIISMLLMLGDLRVKAFPKILAIVESVLRSHIGKIHKDRIIGYLSEFLEKLSLEEERNKYLIAWLSYFFVSNGYEKRLKFKPKYKDPIIRAIMSNRPGKRFKKNEFVLFEGCRKSAKRVTMLQHLEVFASPPKNG